MLFKGTMSERGADNPGTVVDVVVASGTYLMKVLAALLKDTSDNTINRRRPDWNMRKRRRRREIMDNF